ncbi:hypothetical protein D9611_008914 [Ephemerocybe angulata]|uniref:Nephrocystin 3-like N-terminal domain-containing protein n=1 Tax=Ephemerocybe angulata TaxID=980116 RepID=A0A8H5C0J1_9AGAR|nr:hypothetical protein D9611_008914 [Tulosesus angulatus]
MEQETHTSLPMHRSPSPQEASQGTDFFRGAQNFSIDNQYNIGEQHISIKSANPGLLDILNPIPDASYTRNRKTSPPDSSCLPGTRQDVLQKVTSWADSSVLSKNKGHVMWLYGYVGCGKSAIAQEVAEHYARKKRLAASFFFFRGSGDRNRTGRFAPTIAHQLAGAIPSTSRFIETNVKAHAGLLEPRTSLSAQFQHLVYDPIKSAKWDLLGTNVLRGPYLIVIDGLDECEDRDEIASFIHQMLAFFKDNPRIPLRVLITSRVEEHIRTRLDPGQVEFVNLVDHTTLHDIRTAFHAHFTFAAKYNRTIQCYGEWPTPSDLEKLVVHTGCSFIFMSTLAKFILEPSDDGLTPMDRLPFALNINPGLDGLYGQTLSRAEHLPHFSHIIWTIALLGTPLSIQALSDLLGIRIFEIVEILVHLHAILQVPGDDTTPVTMCHSSLHDFLTSPSRSGRYHAPAPHHKRLAYACMRILGPAHEYIRKQSPSPGSTEDIHAQDTSIYSAADYAEIFWEFHWRAFTGDIALDNKDMRRNETICLISYFRQAHYPYCELVFATYILMNPELLPPMGAIYPASRNKVDPEVHDHTLVEILQENVPPAYSKVMIQAISIVRCRRPHFDGEELQYIWGNITPPLPDLFNYYSDLLAMCVKNVFASICWESFTCNITSFRSRTSFVWCLLSLPQHLTEAIQREASGQHSWPLKYQQSFETGNSNALYQVMHCFDTVEALKPNKDGFIQSVRSALQAAAEITTLQEHRASAQSWKWAAGYSSTDSRIFWSRPEFHSGTQTLSIELRDVLFVSRQRFATRM